MLFELLLGVFLHLAFKGSAFVYVERLKLSVASAEILHCAYACSE